MKYLFLFLFACLSKNVFCQLSTIPNKQDASFEPEEFVPLKDGGFLVLKKSEPETYSNQNKARYQFSIVKYSSEMVPVKEELVSNNEKGFSVYYSSIKQSANKYWLIYTEGLKPSRKSNYANIMACEIDTGTLKTGTSNIIADEKSINEGIDGYFSRYNDYSLRIILESSPNKKYHALFLSNGNGEFYISRINEKFEPIWKSKETIPGFDLIELRSFAIDNDGDILVAHSNLKSGVLLSFYPPNGSVVHKELATEKANLHQAFFAMDKLGQVLVTGICKNSSDRVVSAFKSTLNRQSLTLESIEIAPFPAELVEELQEVGFASAKAKSYGLEPYGSRCRPIIDSNGVIHLIMECTNRTFGFRNVAIASYIILANFNEPKATISYIPRYSALNHGDYNEQYFYSLCSNKIAIVYFDNVENLTKSLSEKPTTFKWGNDGVLIAAFVNTDGTIVRKQITENLSKGLWPGVKHYLSKQCDL